MALSSNWRELSVDDAADLVAARVTVVGLRTKQADGPARGMFDQLVPPAGKTLDWLNPLNDPKAVGGPNAPNKVTGVSEVDPFWGTARSGVVGAGIGLGLGGLQALMTPSRKRRWLHSLLSGAMLGGGAGLGLGAAMNYGGQAVAPNKEQLLAATQSKIKSLQAIVEDSTKTPAAKEQAITEIAAANTELQRLGGPAAPTKPINHDPTPEQRAAAGLPPETRLQQTTKWVGRNPEEATARGVGAAVGAGLGGKASLVGHDHMLWKKLQAGAKPPISRQAFHGSMSPGRRYGRGLLGVIGSLAGGYVGQGIGGQTRSATGTKLPILGGPHVDANGQTEFIPTW